MRKKIVTPKFKSPTMLEVSEARMERFLRDFKAYEQGVYLQDTMDTFLDVLSQSKKNSGDWLLRLRAVSLFFELRQNDPNFTGTISWND